MNKLVILLEIEICPICSNMMRLITHEDEDDLPELFSQVGTNAQILVCVSSESDETYCGYFILRRSEDAGKDVDQWRAEYVINEAALT